MGPSKQKNILVGADMANTLNAVRTAISQCGWKISKINQNLIKASTGISMTSWGETITITFQLANNGTLLNIQSKSGWALVDWGKNNNNISSFIEILGRMLPLYNV